MSDLFSKVNPDLKFCKACREKNYNCTCVKSRRNENRTGTDKTKGYCWKCSAEFGSTNWNSAVRNKCKSANLCTNCCYCSVCQKRRWKIKQADLRKRKIRLKEQALAHQEAHGFGNNIYNYHLQEYRRLFGEELDGSPALPLERERGTVGYYDEEIEEDEDDECDW